MTLVELRDLLLTIGVPAYHFEAHKEKGNYIVWAEDGQGDSGYADNRMTTQVIQGTIDYYTKTEFDPVFKQIQEKLNSVDIAWRLNSIQHEENTGYIHYEWVWEMV
ncbi:hypothetical protein CACET_c31810 [Clostridium aceticum]|uniref:Uncharacterized protein n=1 Tax=Clostridium aceticum TaxID=84022 RepID=A0A0D8IA20_9CLOT|nr:hypothetical protein [Clostridium aceticum]AKL96625.1 hypothetical protein CACET_c31810 [Clostridium aceticum]KJF26071.1 hypothetical protein TZ02_15225 [Clostridium aceticum]